MNTFYLLGFTGGACGDFICSKISQLENFHPAQSKRNFITNTTEYVSDIDPDYKIKSAHKIEHLSFDNDTIDRINNVLVTKNIITPTHYIDDITNTNIPNIIPIKLHYHVRLSKLFCTLLWIKRMSNVWTGKDPYNTIKDRPVKYIFQKTMLDTPHTDLRTFIDRYYIAYCRNTIIPKPGWRLVNTDSLFLKPHEYISEFNSILELPYTIEPDIIAEYHESNLRLIEHTFNKTPTNFFNGDWMGDLHQWLLKTCPT